MHTRLHSKDMSHMSTVSLLIIIYFNNLITIRGHSTSDVSRLAACRRRGLENKVFREASLVVIHEMAYQNIPCNMSKDWFCANQVKVNTRVHIV